MGSKKLSLIAAIIPALVFISSQTQVYEAAVNSDESHPELTGYGYYLNDSYDLIYDFSYEDSSHSVLNWRRTDLDRKNRTMRLYFADTSYMQIEDTITYGHHAYKDMTLRIPDKINNYTVREIYGSCPVKAFDVDPENEYFTSDGQTIFSKDGEKMLSYAQFDISSEYYIPDGTKTLGESALCDCPNIKTLYVPASVSMIEERALAMENADEIVFDDIGFYIDKRAFGYCSDGTPQIKLSCSKNISIFSGGSRITWDDMQGADHYELYQKISEGEYKLAAETSRTSCVLRNLKADHEYTFAVKPIWIVNTGVYNTEWHEIFAEIHYPETLTVEGRMSEDVVVKG